jgi:hypothetical protein
MKVGRYPCRSIAELGREAFNNGADRFRLGDIHADHSPLHLLAGVGLGVAIVLLILSLLSPLAADILGLAIGLYLLLVIGISLYLTISRSQPFLMLYLPIIFGTIHISSAAGFLVTAIDRLLGRTSPPPDPMTEDFPKM